MLPSEQQFVDQGRHGFFVPWWLDGQLLRKSTGPAYEFMERISPLGDARVPWGIYEDNCGRTTMGVKTPVR